jgi:hypothetical protein
MKNQYTCAACGKPLDVVYWSQSHPFCDVHCLLAWEAVQMVRKMPFNQLRFTFDSPATTE